MRWLIGIEPSLTSAEAMALAQEDVCDLLETLGWGWVPTDPARLRWVLWLQPGLDWDAYERMRAGVVNIARTLTSWDIRAHALAPLGQGDVPRLLTVGAREGAEELGDLRDRLTSAAAWGSTSQSVGRPWRPVLRLGRVQRRRGASDAAGLFSPFAGVDFGRTTVQELVVWRQSREGDRVAEDIVERIALG